MRRKAGTQSLGPGRSVAGPVSWPPANSSHRSTWGNAQEGSIGYTRGYGNCHTSKSASASVRAELGWKARRGERGSDVIPLVKVMGERREKKEALLLTLS